MENWCKLSVLCTSGFPSIRHKIGYNLRNWVVRDHMPGWLPASSCCMKYWIKLHAMSSQLRFLRCFANPKYQKSIPTHKFVLPRYLWLDLVTFHFTCCVSVRLWAKWNLEWLCSLLKNLGLWHPHRKFWVARRWHQNKKLNRWHRGHLLLENFSAARFSKVSYQK